MNTNSKMVDAAGNAPVVGEHFTIADGSLSGTYEGIRPSQHTGEPMHFFADGVLGVTPQSVFAVPVSDYVETVDPWTCHIDPDEGHTFVMNGAMVEGMAPMMCTACGQTSEATFRIYDENGSEIEPRG